MTEISTQLKIEKELPLSNGDRLLLTYPVTRELWKDKSLALRNIYLMGADGNCKWRIAPAEGVFHETYFVGVDLISQEAALGRTFDGIDYDVSLKDGSVKQGEWHK